MSSHSHTFDKLTPKLALQLAAPHSWVASIVPVCVGTCLSMQMAAYDNDLYYLEPEFVIPRINYLMALILLVISILFQSAVNVINDYFDFAKGTDTKENQPDPSDAVLVYNNLNPKHVLALAVGLIVLAFVLGLYVIYCSGWVPLAVAVVGVIVICTYSGGKHPISYLPLGEIVSGFTMGGLITFASYVALTGEISFIPLVISIPVMIGIAQIMATNNICDIQKDKVANRKTYAVLVGYDRAIKKYRAALIEWIATLVLISVIIFPTGCVIAIVGTFLLRKQILALYKLDLEMKTRPIAFGLVTKLNKLLGLTYALTILISCVH